MKGVLPDLARAPEAILARGGALGRPLHLLAETQSTSDDAKAAAKAGAEHGSTWVAERQLAGRGRQGRAWFAVPGESLVFSVLLRMRCAPVRLPPLALVAGLAVRDAVARAAPTARVMIKWPNDVVVVNGCPGLQPGGREATPFRKVAGVLVEASLKGREVESVVAGVGINVHVRHFPAELAALATSVALVSDRPADRAELLADVLAGLDRDAELVAARGLGPVHAVLAAADALAGREVRSERGEGTACGIDLEGRLLVRGEDGTVQHWNAGEVHLR